MKILKLLFLHVFVALTISDAQTWQKIEMNYPPSDSLFSGANVVFATKNVGWISIHGSDTSPATQFFTWICKTTNGGMDWIIQKNISNNFNGYNLFTTDSLHCWAYDTDGNLMFTTDGGSNWMDIYIGGSPAVYPDLFFGLYFFNNQDGIAINRIRPWFTTNGGKSWTAGDRSRFDITPGDIAIVGKNKGWIISGDTPYRTDGGYIANTIDGGKTWKYQDSTTLIMTGVDFIDSLHGFATATNWNSSTGFVYSTTDGGENWQHQQFLRSGAFRDIGFIDDKNGWITGDGKILNTTDGGITWETQVQDFPFVLRKLILLKEEKVAYIFGDNFYGPPFTLLFANLDDITEVSEKEENIPKEFQLMQNYPNPFNPITKIKYTIPKISFVTLQVYNALGKEVATLVNGSRVPGNYEVKFDAGNLSSGVYIYKIQAGNYIASKKLILLK